jgi:hypothetical protein
MEAKRREWRFGVKEISSFFGSGFAHEAEKARVGRAKLCEVLASLAETDLAVDGHVHLRGVVVLLAVVLPPANGAKGHGSGRVESLVTATRAAEPQGGRRKWLNTHDFSCL